MGRDFRAHYFSRCFPAVDLALRLLVTGDDDLIRLERVLGGLDRVVRVLEEEAPSAGVEGTDSSVAVISSSWIPSSSAFPSTVENSGRAPRLALSSLRTESSHCESRGPDRGHSGKQ